MKCKNCREGQPKFWTSDGGFCNVECWLQWRKKENKPKLFRTNIFGEPSEV